jgi:hypothetical protein
MALLRAEEETELFIQDYTEQIRLMNKLSDIQIKVVLKHLLEEDSEWAEVLKRRFRTKQLRKTKELIKDVQKDTLKSIRDLSRKVA